MPVNYEELSEKVRSALLRTLRVDAKQDMVDQSTSVHRAMVLALATAWRDAVVEEFELLTINNPNANEELKFAYEAARSLMGEDDHNPDDHQVVMVPGVAPAVLDIEGGASVVSLDQSMGVATPLIAIYLDKAIKHHAAWLRAEEIVSAPKIKEVFSFSNGHTVAFGQNNDLMSEFTGLTAEVLPKIRASGYTADIPMAQWRRSELQK